MIIPVDAHLLTFRVITFDLTSPPPGAGTARPGTTRIRVPTILDRTTRRTEASVKAALSAANQTWLVAGIQFQLRSCRSEPPCQLPGDVDTPNEELFYSIAQQYPSRGGAISLLLVHRFDKADLGGVSHETQPVCAVADASPSVIFAHEFGHLLSLDDTSVSGTLMNGGLVAPNAALRPIEVPVAQQSPLARRFAGSR